MECLEKKRRETWGIKISHLAIFIDEGTFVENHHCHLLFLCFGLLALVLLI